MGIIKVGATLISQDDKFLLIKSIRGVAKDLWNNPGGKTNTNESFEDCAQRETFEETGFVVKLGKLLIRTEFQQSEDIMVIKEVFAGEVVGGKLNIPKDEIGEARWFTAEEIKNSDQRFFTFGATQSVEDFTVNKFKHTYYPDKIA